MLIAAFNLTERDTANSWIGYCKMKVSTCTYLDRNSSIRVVGRIMRTEKEADSINGYQSHCEVTIGNILIKIGVDHTVNIKRERPMVSNPEIDISGLCVLGYRKRKHIIEDIFYSIDKKICSASLIVEDYFEPSKGIGANYRAFILQDIISISGQLSQVLLYKIENTDRQSANNMWLRECSIVYNRPFESCRFMGGIAFSRFDEVMVNGDPWRCVGLSSSMGGIKAQFKIAHKINRNQ
jgi:hypothetical protein